MDDREVENFSGSRGDLPSGVSMNTFFDELLKDTPGCTHIHTCNPPGPDYSHTHTCFHVHSKILPTPATDKLSNSNDDDSAESVERKTTKRPLGNREAVRKYREKKKARAASLEDELFRLKALNQQLLKRLHSQAALEAEVARLKCFLVDIRGRIEGEIGSFPYKKSVKYPNMSHTVANPGRPGPGMMNHCNVQCGDEIYSLQPGADGKIGETSLDGQGFSGCDFESLNCFADVGAASKEFVGCGPCDIGHLAPTANTSGDSKMEGANCEATAG